MIETYYCDIPEMEIKMRMWNDIGGNSQRTEIILKAPAQPFEVNDKETEEIRFTVVGTWELSELIRWLSECQKACYDIKHLQSNCAKDVSKD